MGRPGNARVPAYRQKRSVVAKIEWRGGELFPRMGFIVTNFNLPDGKLVKVYIGRVDIENRSKEGKNTLSRDRAGCSWGSWRTISCS